MKKIMILAVALLLIASCATASTERDDSQVVEPDTNNTNEGVEIMNEPLLTGEQLLELVARYEEILGVTVADFDDIDMEDFIEWNTLTEHAFYAYIDRGGIFLPAFNQYVSMLGTRAKDAYLPTERRMVDSTEEEFERFKVEFFEKIGGEEGVQPRRGENALVESYSFMDGEEMDGFLMGRTMHFERLASEFGWIFNEVAAAGVLIPDHDMHLGISIYISRNGKFFIAFDGFWPLSIETIQAFMEIED